MGIRYWGTDVCSSDLAWFLRTGKRPPREVDHRNGARVDNRWCNLRKATKAQNQANVRRRRDNTSGVKGVTLSKARKKWVAQIQAGGKRMSLGGFPTIDAAANAYQDDRKSTRLNSSH